MKKVFPIDKTLSKIFDEAEKEFIDEDISRDQIKDIFYLFWYNSKQFMKSLLFPTIIFPKWGRYSPSINNLKKLEKKRGENSLEIKNTINRLNNEKQKRKRND